MCIRPLTGIRYEDGRIELIKKQDIINKIWRYQKNEEFKKHIVLVKCGKCRECLKNKMAEITKRINKELTFWKKSTIATLTFNEENKKETFEEVKSEYQKFFKRIRKKYKVRYFLAIEKGEKNERLHIHTIIFNYYPEDAEFYKKTKKGSTQYISKELNKFWLNGLATFEQVNKKSINYCIKYMFKGKEKALYYWSKKPPLGIAENENLIKLEEKIENGEQLPKCYKNFAERKLNKKIELNEKAQKIKNQLEEERKNNIEKTSKMELKEYYKNRFFHLT